MSIVNKTSVFFTFLFGRENQENLSILGKYTVVINQSK